MDSSDERHEGEHHAELDPRRGTTGSSPSTSCAPRSLAGEVDTVIVAFTDMQGRLQGKRLHGHYFLDHVLEHGTEGCNYLLAVDVDMNTVDGYAMSSWERGYGDMFFEMDLDDAAPHARAPGTR